MLPPSFPEGIIKFLREELPFIWRDAYIETTSHPVNIVRWLYGSFEYIFDDYTSLESRGTVPYAADIEGRLIGVWDVPALKQPGGMIIG